jgi:hypothetical protein
VAATGANRGQIFFIGYFPIPPALENIPGSIHALLFDYFIFGEYPVSYKINTVTARISFRFTV